MMFGKGWRRRQDIPVEFFTRKDCPLCDEALAVLRSRAGRHGLKITCYDIASDPELMSAYGETIPVVRIDGKDRFSGHVNPVLLDRLLKNRS